MPALPAAPGVLKVTIPFSTAGDSSALSRFFVHYSGTAPSSAFLSTFCDSVSSAFGTNLASLMMTSWTQLAVQAEDLSSATGAIGAGTTNHAGTLTYTPIPNSACVMMQFLIARRYRGGKPKIFLPFGNSPQLTASGQWGAAFLALVNTGWTNFIAAVLAAGWTGAGTLTHANVSYYSGFSVVTNPVTHRARNVPTLRGTPIVDTVTAYSVEPSVASQRRRNVV